MMTSGSGYSATLDLCNLMIGVFLGTITLTQYLANGNEFAHIEAVGWRSGGLSFHEMYNGRVVIRNSEFEYG